MIDPTEKVFQKLDADVRAVMDDALFLTQNEAITLVKDRLARKVVAPEMRTGRIFTSWFSNTHLKQSSRFTYEVEFGSDAPYFQYIEYDTFHPRMFVPGLFIGEDGLIRRSPVGGGGMFTGPWEHEGWEILPELKKFFVETATKMLSQLGFRIIP